jgi:hypothetical protein
VLSGPCRKRTQTSHTFRLATRSWLPASLLSSSLACSKGAAI